MAETLDYLLEPGERVLYRDPRRLAPAAWLLTLLGLGYAAAVLYVVGVGPWVFAAAGLLLSARAVWRLAGDFLPEAVVTDRRVLERTGWRRPQITAIALEEIRDLRSIPSGVPGYLKITGRFGEVERLYHLRRPQPFCRALARAAALPCPPLVGRLENTADYCVSLGGLSLTGALFWGLYRLFDAIAPTLAPASMAPQHIVFLMLAVFAIPTLYLGLALGTHLAGLLSIPLLRPFVTLEEQQNWLCQEVENEATNKRGRRLRPLYLKWAGLLWGQPLHCETRVELRHGQ